MTRRHWKHGLALTGRNRSHGSQRSHRGRRPCSRSSKRRSETVLLSQVPPMAIAPRDWLAPCPTLRGISARRRESIRAPRGRLNVPLGSPAHRGDAVTARAGAPISPCRSRATGSIPRCCSRIYAEQRRDDQLQMSRRAPQKRILMSLKLGLIDTAIRGHIGVALMPQPCSYRGSSSTDSAAR